jgi:general nucleoside transport system permease protein
MLEILFSEHTLNSGISLATPILLCAMGGAICSKAGNFNIALEGFMLIGAFFGVVGSYFLHSAFLGVIFAMTASMLFALLYGVFHAHFKAHEIILGFGFNMLAIALTGWLLSPVFGGKGSFYDPTTPTLSKIVLPWISDVPVLRTLSGHNIIVYLSWLLILVLYIFMYKTPMGYKIRAIGENPKALVATGLSVKKHFFIAEALTGLLCGLAGAFLSIGNLSMFTENMTAGRGFIAVAAVGFSGGFLPVTALASILFGLANGVAIQLQGLGFPTQIIDMIPYLLTIIMIVPYALRQRKKML